jgi:class 3 adenylate cyclase
MAGDGVMAIFGEYSLDPKVGVTSAVDAAKKMWEEFGKLKTEFLASKEIDRTLEERYEPLDFDLGIGINCGVVLFDYFGAIGSRSYGPLGDNVNFAQRIEDEASRFDERLNRLRQPILVSGPVWRLAGEPDWPAVIIEVPGKPYKYRAHEVTVRKIP